MRSGTYSTPGGTTLYSYNLNGFATPAANPGYDSVGNVVGLRDSVVGQWKFGYDTLNRLQSATGISGGFNGINVSAASQGWTYDSFGNRTGQSAGSSQTPTQWATYSVAAANNRVATSNGAPGGLSYDGDGRLLNDGAKAYLWEMQGWLCGVTSAGNHYQYIYDAEGRLVTTASRPDAQCGLNTTTLADYVVDQFGRQITEADGSAHWRHTNVYADGELLATYDSAGLHYALNDWLGDKRVQALASSTGTTVEETCWNLPFNDGFGCSGTGADATEQHYTGKEHDKYVPQLDHFGARSYTGYSGRFISPDWSAKIEPVPYSKLDNPQSLNLYSYTLNNPLSNVDTDGHACSGILGNTGSGFCTRATEYGKIDGNATARSQTRFFAAASAVSSALADVNAPGASIVSGVSGQTASFLEGVGQKLQAFNEGEAHVIASGNMSRPGLDQQLVHNEQTMVQGSLDSLKQSNPDAYNQTISQINGALNPGTVTGAASNLFSTDKAYAGVLDGVRKDLGRNIDFSNQGDREAIGNALVNHIRQTGGCDVTGSKGSGCH